MYLESLCETRTGCDRSERRACNIGIGICGDFGSDCDCRDDGAEHNRISRSTDARTHGANATTIRDTVSARSKPLETAATPMPSISNGREHPPRL